MTNATYSPTAHIEKVLDELADLMQQEVAAGGVSAPVVEKFNHLVNSWNIAQKALSRHRSDQGQSPAPGAAMPARTEVIVVEKPAAPTAASLPDTIGIEQRPITTLKLSTGYINLGQVLFLSTKNRNVVMPGMVLPIEDENDLRKIAYHLGLYQTS
jgi:hypothetical protein